MKENGWPPNPTHGGVLVPERLPFQWGMAKSLAKSIYDAGSKLYSVEILKTEEPMQGFGKVIRFKIKEKTEVIEGEVVEIWIERERLLSGGWVASRTGKLMLKTTEMGMAYDLEVKITEALEKEKVQSGNVIAIHKASGKIT